MLQGRWEDFAVRLRSVLSGRSQPFPSIPSRHVCVICLSLPPLFFSGFCGICLILLVVSSNPTHSSF